MISIDQRIDKRNKIRQGSLSASVMIYILVGMIALITVLPFVFIISSSISDPQLVAAGKIWLLPQGFSVEAYKRVLHSTAMLRAFLNSVFFAAVITVLNVLNSVMCGFGLSKKGMLGRKILVVYILIPMYFGAGLIPSFIIMNRLGLFNNLLAIILPSSISIWNIILARTFISKMPQALMEAADIDGASVPQKFFKIVVPLSKPIIAVLSLYTALAVWNSWFNFMIYLPNLTQWHPLQYFLVKALLWGNTQATLKLESQLSAIEIRDRLRMAAVAAQMKYAVVVVTTVPIMLVYPFVQKYFIQGAMLGSLKE